MPDLLILETLRAAQTAAQAACDVWQAELERLYGRKAGDARYDPRGTATPELVALYTTFRQTSDAQQDAFAAWLGARRIA